MLRLLFFRGHGIVPILVRLFTWRPLSGQRWKDVPAHVAIVTNSPDGIPRKYEAVITGIQSTVFIESENSADKSVIAEFSFISDTGFSAYHYLEDQVGDRYGFEAVALTGMTVLAPRRIDKKLASIWAKMYGGKNGETCPLHCSLLAKKAMEAAGLPDVRPRKDGMPLSPNDLMTGLLAK